jgi:hypothetical protein
MQIEASYECNVFGGYYSSHVAVSVDPVIKFDQQAFDNQQGSNTFNLSDYYEIVLSSPTTVPEPSTLLLIGPGLAGLWVWGRKKFKCI